MSFGEIAINEIEQIAKPQDEERKTARILIPESHDRPVGYVTLYRIAKRQDIEQIKKEGFPKENNHVEDLGREIEELFNEKASERGINIDRTDCVYAMPRNPIGLNLNYDVLDDEVVVEIFVNPTNDILVGEGEDFTQACIRLNDGFRNNALSYIDQYWDDSKTLQQYLNEGYVGEGEEEGDFQMPEILIPRDIPPEHVGKIYCREVSNN